MIPRIGQTVRAFRSVFGHNEAGRDPAPLLMPDMTATVAGVRVPCVRPVLCAGCKGGKHAFFHLVEFDDPATGQRERAAVHSCNLRGARP